MTPRIVVSALFFVLAVAGDFRAEARVYEKGPVVVSHPWARATAPGARTGAAYLKIESAPGAKDRLIGARSPVAEAVEVHETIVTDGIARMRRVEAIEIAPGRPADLAPGGAHLMLMGLKSPLKKGDSFPLILTFAQAGEVALEVVVEAPGAMGPHHGASPAHKH
jgi:periplasmic copper chaperone A